MPDSVEDLVQLARSQFEQAPHHCATCLPYHALWPYLRITRQVGGVEADEPVLAPLLADLMRGKPRRVLVAGAADSGVAALVHRAALASGTPGHAITVADRCSTPLLTCQRHAQANGIALRTLHTDLRQLPADGAHDVAIGHSVLQFFSVDQRHQALLALRGALARDGRLVLVSRLAAPDRERGPAAREPGEWARALLHNLVHGLAEQQVPLPCPPSDLEPLVEHYVRANGYHVAPHETEQVLRDDLQRAGFDIDRLSLVGKGMAFSADGKVTPTGRQGLVVVARPRA